MHKAKCYVIEVPEMGVRQPVMDLSDSSWATMLPATKRRYRILEFEFSRIVPTDEAEKLMRDAEGA